MPIINPTMSSPCRIIDLAWIIVHMAPTARDHANLKTMGVI